MDILLWIVRIAHFILVAILFVSVFINSKKLKEFALIILSFIMVKYFLGYDKCVLTQLEYKLLGKENHEKGFIYRFMKPITNIPEHYFEKGLVVFHTLWILILVHQLSKMGCDFLSLI